MRSILLNKERIVTKVKLFYMNIVVVFRAGLKAG